MNFKILALVCFLVALIDHSNTTEVVTTTSSPETNDNVGETDKTLAAREAERTVEEYRSNKGLNNDNTAIMRSACGNANAAVVAALLDFGVSCETRLGSTDQTCLHYATWGRNLDLIKLLITRGCDVNIRSNTQNTPLMIAAYSGNLSVVKELIKRGADVSLRSERNLTALGLAKQRRHEDVVLYLKSINAPE